MRDHDVWHSFHIHYDDFEAQDKLIVNCLAPLVDRLEGEGLLRRWFFIRYFENGPHIRFRVYPSESSVADDVRGITLTHVERFLRAEPAADRDIPIVPRYPNNSVHETPYDPEVARYGGVRGVAIAEDHFHHSSRAAVAIIRSVQESSATLGHKFVGAVELASMIAYSGGFVGPRTGEYIDDHLRHVIMPAPLPFNVSDVPEPALRTLVARARQIARLYEEPRPHDRAHGLRSWKSAMDETCAALRTHVEGDPSYRQTHPHLDCSQKYVLILQSYTHMLLNRLGYWGKAEHAVLRTVRDLGAIATAVRPVIV